MAAFLVQGSDYVHVVFKLEGSRYLSFAPGHFLHPETVYSSSTKQKYTTSIHWVGMKYRDIRRMKWKDFGD